MTRKRDHIAIKLRPAAEKKILQGHPWVFSDSIVKQSKQGKPGDLAIIFGQKHNKFLGVGLYDPDSPIRIRMIHTGSQVRVDASWLKEKLLIAYSLRQPLLQNQTNSFRLVYGENDGLSALIIDVYADVLVLKLYSAVWFPWLEDLISILPVIIPAKAMVLRLSRHLQQWSDSYSDGQLLYGSLDTPEVEFLEHGLRFSANVLHGHKTGYFLDHRHNRAKVGLLSRGKSVLDVFAYAGGFSVHALAGGASRVVSLDISEQALEQARKNVSLNQHTGIHEIMAADAFEGMQELLKRGEKFDIVVIDPPSFAKRQSEIPGAKSSYKRLIRLGIPLVKKEGILVMASCSSRITFEAFFELIHQELQSMKLRFELIERTAHDLDHPVTFPEGAYLKCGYYRIL